MKTRRYPEEGFLVVGLSLLMTSLFACAWIVYVTARLGATMDAAAQHQADVLRAASEQSQGLNRIALNNSLLLLHVEEALSVHLRSTLAAVVHQNTVPFWKAKLFSTELSSQDDLKSFLEASSTAFANELRVAYALSLDNKKVHQTLSQIDPAWHQGLRPFGSQASLCLALEAWALKEADFLRKTLQVLSLRDVEIGDCSVRVGGFSIFEVDDMSARLDQGRLAHSPALGLLVWGVNPPLQQSHSAQEVAWTWSPAKTWFLSKDHLKLKPLQMELIHPAMRENARPAPVKQKSPGEMLAHPIAPKTSLGAHHLPETSLPLRALLEPNWVPVLRLENGVP